MVVFDTKTKVIAGEKIQIPLLHLVVFLDQRFCTHARTYILQTKSFCPDTEIFIHKKVDEGCLKKDG